MELKTLKDILFKIPGNHTESKLGNKYIKDELRLEAIKWRKKSMKLSARKIDYLTWDNFFNISEENLK